MNLVRQAHGGYLLEWTNSRLPPDPKPWPANHVLLQQFSPNSNCYLCCCHFKTDHPTATDVMKSAISPNFLSRANENAASLLNARMQRPAGAMFINFTPDCIVITFRPLPPFGGQTCWHPVWGSSSGLSKVPFSWTPTDTEAWVYDFKQTVSVNKYFFFLPEVVVLGRD